jgi:hypothetical protein
MADITAQNGMFFWGTTAIIAVYTIIIMFVNVGIKPFRQPNTTTHITRLSSVPTHPMHGYLLSRVQSVTTSRALTTLWQE